MSRGKPGDKRKIMNVCSVCGEPDYDSWFHGSGFRCSKCSSIKRDLKRIITVNVEPYCKERVYKMMKKLKESFKKRDELIQQAKEQIIKIGEL